MLHRPVFASVPSPQVGGSIATNMVEGAWHGAKERISRDGQGRGRIDATTPATPFAASTGAHRGRDPKPVRLHPTSTAPYRRSRAGRPRRGRGADSRACASRSCTLRSSAARSMLTPTCPIEMTPALAGSTRRSAARSALATLRPTDAWSSRVTASRNRPACEIRRATPRLTPMTSGTVCWERRLSVHLCGASIASDVTATL